MQEISQLIQKVVLEVFNESVEVELNRTDEQFGDYATNVALRLSKKIGQNPREVAQQIADKLSSTLITKVAVAGPGFINLTLSDQALLKLVQQPLPQPLAGQVIVAEYSDPNPFKVLHAGHLYTSIVGDGIANLLEQAGAEVHRVNFGGDVGLHVAKTMWAILKKLGGAYPEKLKELPEDQHATWMTEAYITGTKAYDDSSEVGADPSVKIDIITLNKIIYNYYSKVRPLLVLPVPSTLGSDSSALQSEDIVEIYRICRQWSYDYFNAFYARIGSQFEKYYPESQTAELGLQTVREHVGDVYEESDGAIIFDGEKYGLHTRVFINREGLPTYEAKDVGLIMLKKKDYNFDRSVIMTGNEQAEYMKVVLKSIEQFAPELAQATTHLTHGLVKLAGGVKMSSRKGNILRAVDVLDAAAAANQAANNQSDERVSLGAIKYAFLKVRTGGDIIYDPNESVNMHGNSGPYLQYAHARACSVLEKATAAPADTTSLKVESSERSLLRKLSEYAEVVERATTELAPHHICTYLYELAQTFNRFYEQSRVIGDEREPVRIQLVSLYANVLKSGLELLGIHAPEKM